MQEIFFERDPDLLSAGFDADTVMMSISRGEYYGMNEVGSRIWALLETPQSLTGLCDRLCAEYAIEPQDCLSELSTFLAELQARGMVRARTVQG